MHPSTHRSKTTGELKGMDNGCISEIDLNISKKVLNGQAWGSWTMDANGKIDPSISKKFLNGCTWANQSKCFKEVLKWMDLGKLDNGEFRKMGVEKGNQIMNAPKVINPTSSNK